MTQFQFDMICKIIQNGAPAVAGELCGALNDLVVDYNKLAEKLDSAQKALEQQTKASSEQAEENS